MRSACSRGMWSPRSEMPAHELGMGAEANQAEEIERGIMCETRRLPTNEWRVVPNNVGICLGVVVTATGKPNQRDIAQTSIRSHHVLIAMRAVPPALIYPRPPGNRRSECTRHLAPRCV